MSLIIFHLVFSAFTFEGVDMSMAEKILNYNIKRYPNGKLAFPVAFFVGLVLRLVSLTVFRCLLPLRPGPPQTVSQSAGGSTRLLQASNGSAEPIQELAPYFILGDVGS